MKNTRLIKVADYAIVVLKHLTSTAVAPLTSMGSPSRSRSTWAQISFSFTEDCGGEGG